MAKGMRVADWPVLGIVVDAGENGTFLPLKQTERVVELGYAEIHAATVNDSGTATRATEVGVAAYQDKFPVDVEEIEGDGSGEALPPVEEEFSEQALVEELKEKRKLEIAKLKPTQGSFEIESGIAMAKSSRGGKGARKYPFDALEPGQSFHVAPTRTHPDPFKKMGSTTSTANRRNKDSEGDSLKVFAVRRVGEDDPKGVGSRVFRVS